MITRMGFTSNDLELVTEKNRRLTTEKRTQNEPKTKPFLGLREENEPIGQGVRGEWATPIRPGEGPYFTSSGRYFTGRVPWLSTAS